MNADMGRCLWLALVLGVLGFLAYRGACVWIDAGRRGLGLARRLGWALLGTVVPSRYWWGARIGALSPHEQADLLARETVALGLSRADGLRCPLCGAEVARAWALTAGGRSTVAAGPVACPRCDFRLDTCRHCAHFLPGSAQVQGQFGWVNPDVTCGRCDCYKVTQPVEQTCAPEVARRLKARGWEQIRAPLPIVDSFVPPDFCTAFRPDRKRLRAGGVRWPDARRVALLRLLALPPAPETTPPEGLSSGDEQWLL
jgi:DNA-directed RNA polymerase subunit RPC12/RpoP